MTIWEMLPFVTKQNIFQWICHHHHQKNMKKYMSLPHLIFCNSNIIALSTMRGCCISDGCGEKGNCRDTHDFLIAAMPPQWAGSMGMSSSTGINRATCEGMKVSWLVWGCWVNDQLFCIRFGWMVMAAEKLALFGCVILVFEACTKNMNLRMLSH